MDTIFNLPDYRRKHLYFDYGKLILGIPLRPESIPGLKTVRRNQVDQTQPWPIDTKHGLDLTKVTVADLNRFVNNTLKNQFYMRGWRVLLVVTPISLPLVLIRTICYFKREEVTLSVSFETTKSPK